MRGWLRQADTSGQCGFTGYGARPSVLTYSQLHHTRVATRVGGAVAWLGLGFAGRNFAFSVSYRTDR